MVSKLARHSIDVALLPINGRLAARRVAGNLNANEAVQLASKIGARIVIPCHYEMFEFNTVQPDEFVEVARRLGQPYQILRCGERWESTCQLSQKA
jgi:L-ascorbate metabolism protein UlaG (beta-lactamase superfamily)